MKDDELERTGFYTEVRELIDQGYEIDEAVEAVLDNPDYRQNVAALVSQRFRAMRRVETRKQERMAVTSIKNRNFPGVKAALVNRTFALPDGRFVEWTKATKEDHLKRADWCHERADSIRQTGRLHEIAAQLIEDAQVKNLGQIKSIERWPELAELMMGADDGH